MLSLFAKPKRSGKRKEPNMDPETRRVKGQIPLPSWSPRDYRDASIYLERHSRTEGECRVWQYHTKGKVTKFGRAIFRDVQYSAHKLAYFQHHADVRMQQGMMVRQTCGNNLCINPAHLELEKGPVYSRAKNQEPLGEKGMKALAAAAPAETVSEEWLDMDLTPGVGNKSLAWLGVDLTPCSGQSKPDDGFYSLEEWCAMGPALAECSLQKKKKQRG